MSQFCYILLQITNIFLYGCLETQHVVTIDATNLTREEALKALQLIQELLNQEEKKPEENTVPASIFTADISPFQALATYLHQEQKTPREIARVLGRSTQFVNNSIQETTLTTTGHPLPIRIFREELSVLEAATTYLKKQGHSNKQIAAELARSPSTIWIALDRAQKKRGESNE